MTSQEDFINSFHALSGTTIKEKKRSFHKFLIQIKPFHDQLDASLIKPKTLLEELFKIEISIHLKKPIDILSILRSQNRLLINRVLNCRWIVQEFSSEFTAEQLVTEILPTVSHWAKIKLLGRMAFCLTETKSEEIFEMVKDTYGLYLASKLIVSCSTDFIMSQLETRLIEIPPRQLIKIIKRNPDCTKEIWGKMYHWKEKNVSWYKYTQVFIYIMWNQPDLFFKLYDIYKPDIYLGKRTTNKFLRKYKDDVVQNAQKFCTILHKKQIPKTLGEDFEQFYRNLLPKSLNDFQGNLNNYLSYLTHTSSPSKKLHLLLDSFKSVYGNELWDQPDLLRKDLICMMEPDERETWMAGRSEPDSINEETWISFMKPQIAIPLLKKKILLTANKKQRYALILTLIDNAKISNDAAVMFEVCDYIVKKHRNEEFETRQNILTRLIKAFDWVKLSDEHWVLIREYSRLVEVDSRYRPFCVDLLLIKDISRRCEKGLDIEDVVKEGLQKAGVFFQCTCMQVLTKLEHKKCCIMTFPKVFSAVFKKEEDLFSAHIEYFECVLSYNKLITNKHILYSSNLDSLKYLKLDSEMSDSDYTTFQNIISNMVIKECDMAIELGLVKAFLNKKFDYDHSNVIEVLLKKHPSALADSSLSNFMNLERKLTGVLETCGFYQDLGLAQNLSKECLEAINVQTDDYRIFATKQTTIRILGQIMPSKDFVNWARSFNPNELTQDRYSLKLTSFIFRALPYSKSYLDALDYVLSHPQEKDLQKIVTKVSLILASRINEDVLLDFLLKSPTSCYTIKLAQIFVKKQNFVDMLSNLVETIDPALKKQCLKTAFTLFSRSPDALIWSLVKKTVRALDDSNDFEAHAILTKFKQIPSEYFVDYVTFTWDTLNSVKNSTETIQEDKSKFLNAIDSKTILLLPDEFIIGIIRGNWLVVGEKKLEKTLQNSVDEFVYNYIIYYSTSKTVEARIEIVLPILKKYADSTWYNIKTSASGREAIFDLVKKFCSYFLNEDPAIRISFAILSSFLTFWVKRMPRTAMDEYLYLSFTLLYAQGLNNSWSMKQLGQNIGKICTKLDEDGLMNAKVFCKVLKFFEKKLVALDQDGDLQGNLLKIAEGVLDENNSLSACVVILFLLPEDKALTMKVKDGIGKIVEVMLQNPDPRVQIHVNHYLTQNKSDMYWNSKVEN